MPTENVILEKPLSCVRTTILGELTRKVGAGVVVDVGCGEGGAVGEGVCVVPVGAIVHALVGAIVGAAVLVVVVGTLVDTLVGTLVGALVGALVGLHVGAAVLVVVVLVESVVASQHVASSAPAMEAAPLLSTVFDPPQV